MLDGMDPFLLGLGLLITSTIASRFISEAGLRQLSGEQKVIVIDAFAFQRKYSLLMVLGVFVIFYRMPTVLLAFLVLYLLGATAWAFRRLSQLALPASYRRAYLLAQGAQMAGVLAYIAVLATTGGL
jgi:hypothetical protein